MATPDQQLYLVRAELALADNDPLAALAQLEHCRAWEQAMGGATPAYLPWRQLAVSAHLAAGDVTTAHSTALAFERQAFAYGTPGVRGRALHARGLAESDLELLEAAIDSAGGGFEVDVAGERYAVRCSLKAPLR